MRLEKCWHEFYVYVHAQLGVENLRSHEYPTNQVNNQTDHRLQY